MNFKKKESVMDKQITCSKCGNTEDTGESLDGLCPKCLMGLAALGNDDAAKAASSFMERSKLPMETREKWAVAISANPDISPSMSIKGSSISYPPTGDTVLLPETPSKTESIKPVLDSTGFSLVKMIGEGGMGIVYLAQQHSLSRNIAVKMLRPDAIENEHADLYRQFFACEALVTGDLEHPNIVPVHTMGTDSNNNPFFTMKLIQGVSWSDLLHPDQMPSELAGKETILERSSNMTLRDHLNIFLKVCDAIAYAHSKNIIHRDLKPSNVMIGAFGEVLVMDWGLAVDVREKPLPPLKGLPKSGVSTVAGTPYYMAPEQVLGNGTMLSLATDIFMLGAILYEVLTGFSPYGKEKEWDSIVNLIANADMPSPREQAPLRDIPQELAAIAMKAMSREPVDRFASVIEMQGSVDRFLSGEARRAESEKITTEAIDETKILETSLRTSRSSQSYERLTDLQSRLQRALTLWPKNNESLVHLAKITEMYVKSALANGDLLLARTQLIYLESLSADLEQDKEQWRALHERISEAEVSRLAWRRKLRFAIATVILLTACIMIGGGYSLNRIYDEKQTALQEKGNAELARNMASDELSKRRVMEGERNTIRAAQIKEATVQFDKAQERMQDVKKAATETDRHAILQEAETRLSQTLFLIGDDADKFAETPEEGTKLAEFAGKTKTLMIEAYRQHLEVALGFNNLALAGEKIEMAKRVGLSNSETWNQQVTNRIDNEVKRVFSAARLASFGGRPDPDNIYTLQDALNHLIPLKSERCARAVEKEFVTVLDERSKTDKKIGYDDAPVVLAVNALGWVGDAGSVQYLFPMTSRQFKNGAAIDDRVRGEALASICRIAPSSDKKLFSDLENLVWCEEGTVNSTFFRMADTEWRPYAKRVLGDASQIKGLVFAQQWLAAGRSFLGSGRYQEAIAALDKSLEPQPLCPFRRDHLAVVQTLRGAAFEEMRDYDQALAAYNEAERLNKWTQETWPEANKIAQLKIRLSEILSRRGYVFHLKGDKSKAMADFDAALVLNPKNAGAFNNRGIVRAAANGDLSGAIEDLNHAIAIDPQLADAFCNRGNVHVARNEIDTGIKDFNVAMAINPKNISAHVNHGKALLIKSDIEGAQRDFDLVLDLDPRQAEAYWLRSVLQERRGQADKAKTDREKAVAIQPSLASLASKSLTEKNGGLVAVVWAPDRTLSPYTFPSEAYLTRGQILIQRKDYEGALRNFNEMLTLDPENILGLYYRGVDLLNLWRLKEALADFNAVLAKEPNYDMAWIYKGFTLIGMGKDEEAQVCFDKSMKLVEQLATTIKDDAQRKRYLDEKRKYMDEARKEVESMRTKLGIFK